MKRKKGFTLAELLIVVAIIAVLVAISIPIFSSHLEKAREATDLANVRSAYAEVAAAATTDGMGQEFSATVNLKQKQDGWSTNTPITIGGIVSGDNGGTNADNTWVGLPGADGTCKVTYTTEGKIVFEWSGSSGASGSSPTPSPAPEPEISCIVSGTPVTLADGSIKLIDDITADDQLMTFNFHTGTADGNYPLYVMKHEDKDSCVITLTLDNGTTLAVSDGQMFFDMDIREYFEIDSINYPEAVGKTILTLENGDAETARIIGVNAEEQVCTSYDIFTEYNKNFVAAGVLTLEPDTWRQGVYSIGEDLTIDMDRYLADTEEYGLYTYDEFADIMTEDQFEKMGVADTKIAVGKGILGEDEMFALYREWMPVYDEAINSAR